MALLRPQHDIEVTIWPAAGNPAVSKAGREWVPVSPTGTVACLLRTPARRAKQRRVG
jgi:hypothetical protein